MYTFLCLVTKHLIVKPPRIFEIFILVKSLKANYAIFFGHEIFAQIKYLLNKSFENQCIHYHHMKINLLITKPRIIQNFFCFLFISSQFALQITEHNTMLTVYSYWINLNFQFFAGLSPLRVPAIHPFSPSAHKVQSCAWRRKSPCSCLHVLGSEKKVQPSLRDAFFRLPASANAVPIPQPHSFDRCQVPRTPPAA